MMIGNVNHLIDYVNYTAESRGFLLKRRVSGLCSGWRHSQHRTKFLKPEMAFA